jgi:hypothetical protein
MRHFGLLFTILALLTAAFGSGGAIAEGNVQDLAAPAKYPTHFAGVPPQRTRASTPTTGKLMLSFSARSNLHLIWNVYADGRVIWQKWGPLGDPIVIPPGARMIDTGYVQQRLTLQGVQLLRARILSTGLFEHSLRLRVERRHAVWHGAGIFARVRRGDRMVTLSASRFGLSTGHEHPSKATAAQVRGLAQIKALLADTAAWSLPTTAWADRKVRAFVPGHYLYAFDRSAPDLTKLPSPLLPYKELLGHDCQIVTTGQLRAILQAFLEAGTTPVSNHALWIAFALKGFRGIPAGPHFSPVLPSDSC